MLQGEMVGLIDTIGEKVYTNPVYEMTESITLEPSSTKTLRREI